MAGVWNPPVDKADTKIEVEYGMSYPDGTIRWNVDSQDGAYIVFAQLADGKKDMLTAADGHLRKRARNAKVNEEEYIAGHHLVRRSMVRVVTEPEHLGSEVW